MHKWNTQEHHLTYHLNYIQQQNCGNFAMYDPSKDSGNKFLDMASIYSHKG